MILTFFQMVLGRDLAEHLLKILTAPPTKIVHIIDNLVHGLEGSVTPPIQERR